MTYRIFMQAPTALLAISLIGAAAVPAAAQSTDWHDMGGGQIRLVIAPPSEGDETVRGMIDIALDEGWHTYWREPGASGIPPGIDITGSTGLSGAEIGFPAPIWIDNAYGDHAGYTQSVRLPVTFTRIATAPHRLIANLFLGICEDICVPVQTRFTAEIGYARTSTLDAVLVDQAFAALPGAPQPGFGLAKVPARAGGGAMIGVDHTSLLGAEPQMFIHALDGTQLLPPDPVATKDGRTLFEIKPITPSDGPRSIDTVITVTASDRSFTARQTLHLPGAGTSGPQAAN